MSHWGITWGDLEKRHWILRIGLMKWWHGHSSVDYARVGSLKTSLHGPPASMEDLFTHAHNFIRVDEANTENRLRDSKWSNSDNRYGVNHKDPSRRQKEKFVSRPNTRPSDRSNNHKPSFTPLIKSPAKIFARSEGKAFSGLLRECSHPATVETAQNTVIFIMIMGMRQTIVST